jgi:isopentenyl-diphosphate delta-isomerase
MKIPIVNEQDEIIGHKERDNVSFQDIYRITNLWVNDSKGNILLSRRSLNKKVNPGLWSTAVSGTVEEGETYESNIIKEAEEEIGLQDLKPIFDRKIRRTTKRQYFSQWFKAVVNHDYPFVKQEKEVSDIKWFSKAELKQSLRETPEIFLTSVKEHLDYFYETQN